MPQNKDISFVEHLEELRVRLIRCLACFGASAFFVYSVTDKIFPILVKPVGRVIFTSPTEGFLSYVTVALWGAVIMTMPVFLFEAWKFFAAAFEENEQKVLGVIVIVAGGFFMMGCLFAYYVMLPLMLKFFLSFERPFMNAMISAEGYISFVAAVIVSFGLVFELPLVIVFLVKIGIVTPEFLSQKRKYAVVGIFVVSAVMTPSPDAASQILMAVPLLILYELSILFSKVFFPREKPLELKKSFYP